MIRKDVDTMWFLPSALYVNAKKFVYARVNGGSNYNSLKLFATLREKCDVVIRSKSKSLSATRSNCGEVPKNPMDTVYYWQQ